MSEVSDVPYNISLTLVVQNTLLSTSAGNLLRMLIKEWKGSEGTLRKWDCMFIRIVRHAAEKVAKGTHVWFAN